MKVLLALLSIIVVLPLSLIACSTESYDEGYRQGYQKGYTEGWQEGYGKGKEQVQVPTPTPIIPSTIPVLPSPPEKTETQKKLTLADAETVLNFLSVLPVTFIKVDAASEGMSNADMGLGDDFSEVQLFISDEPFQMIYGIITIVDSQIEQASFNSVMNNETVIIYLTQITRVVE